MAEINGTTVTPENFIPVVLIPALESGEHIQGHNTLQMMDGRRCCLGVGIYELGRLGIADQNKVDQILGLSSFPPDDISAQMGLVSIGVVNWEDESDLESLGVSESVLAYINDEYRDPKQKYRPVVAYLKARVAGKKHSAAWEDMLATYKTITP